MTVPAAVFATATSVVSLPGGDQVVVRFGTHWADDDPVVLANPGLFTDDSRFGMSSSQPSGGGGEPPVEQVTANPGERRNLRRQHDRV